MALLGDLRLRPGGCPAGPSLPPFAALTPGRQAPTHLLLQHLHLLLVGPPLLGRQALGGLRGQVSLVLGNQLPEPLGVGLLQPRDLDLG